MTTHRFVVTAHTDPIPGQCLTPESLADAIARSVKFHLPDYVDNVQFLVMDIHTDAGDFHEFVESMTEEHPAWPSGQCKCGERHDHPVHTMPHAWGGTDGSCGSSPCIIPDCQNEKHSVVHNL